MPIGFWAISRQEIKEMLEARTGKRPDKVVLEQVIRSLPELLDKVLYMCIEYYARRMNELKER